MSGIKKLTAIVFVLAMTSTVSAYAGGGSDTLACAEKQKAIFQKVKACIGMEDVRIFQSKNYNMIRKWVKAESRNKDRSVTQSHDATTKNQVTKIGGDFLGISLPKSKISSEAAAEIFDKIENCLTTENVRIIETKDKNTLITWIKEEVKNENRHIACFPNKETGVNIAVSIPK